MSASSVLLGTCLCPTQSLRPGAPFFWCMWGAVAMGGSWDPLRGDQSQGQEPPAGRRARGSLSPCSQHGCDSPRDRDSRSDVGQLRFTGGAENIFTRTQGQAELGTPRQGREAPG